MNESSEGHDGMAGIEGMVGREGSVGMAGMAGNEGNVKGPGLQLAPVVRLRALWRKQASKIEDWLLLLVVEEPLLPPLPPLRLLRCRRARIRVLAVTRLVAVVPAGEGKQHAGEGFRCLGLDRVWYIGEDGCKAMAEGDPKKEVNENGGGEQGLINGGGIGMKRCGCVEVRK
jgi:hypothetical protein